MKAHTPYLWMATGALALGVGAGLAAGAGVAQADTGTTVNGPASSHPRAAASATPTQRHTRDRQAPSPRVAARAKTTTPQALSVTASSVTAPAPAAHATASALTLPSLPTLPSPGVVIQQMINVLSVVANNTPIRGLLDVIDPVSSSPGVSAIRLPGMPVGTAASADGTHVFVITAPPTGGLWSGWLSAYSVAEIDTKTNTIVGIPTAVEGSISGPVELSPDGTRAFVTTAAGPGTRVTVIDTANSSVVNAVDVGNSSGRTLIAPGGNAFVRTGDASSITITMLDGRTGAVTGAPVLISGYPAGDVTFSGDRAYQTASSTTNGVSTTTVTVIDTTDNSVAGVLTLSGVFEGGAVFSQDGTKAAQVTSDPSFGGAAVTLFDPATGAASGPPLLLGGYSTGAMFSDAGNRLNTIVSSASGSQLLVIDTSTGTLVAPPIAIATDSFSTGATVFGPNSDLLYLNGLSVDQTGKIQSTVNIVNTVNATVVGSALVLDGETRGIAVSPDRSHVFQTLTVGAGTTVAIIGTDGGLLGPVITVSGYADRPVEFTTDGSRAYQATSGVTPLVTAIDANTGAVIGGPVGVKGSGVDDLSVGNPGAPVYLTARVTLWELVIPIPFPLVFSVDATHVNAIDTTAF